MRPQPHRPLRPLTDVDPAPLPRYNQPLISQDANRLRDGHASHAVPVGKLWAGGQLVARHEFPRQDRGTQRVRDLLIRGTWVIRVESFHAAHSKAQPD